MDKNDLHPYQLRAVDHILATARCALFLDMGLGKTVSTLTAIAELLHWHEVGRVLIVAPKRVIESVWEQEALKWGHLKHLTFARCHGTEKQRLEALKQDADIVLISRDNLSWLEANCPGAVEEHTGIKYRVNDKEYKGWNGSYVSKTKRKYPFGMVVADELSSFKNHAAERTKSLFNIALSAGRFVGLTGTPAPNGYQDLWSQIKPIDFGARLGINITTFRRIYCSMSRDGFKYTVGDTGRRMIDRRLSGLCLSMQAKDYLTLPPATVIDVKVWMPAKAKELYDAFERDGVMELAGSGDVEALGAGALMGKLAQIAGGAVYETAYFLEVEDQPAPKAPRKVLHIHDAKIEALFDLIEAANGKPVLCGWAYQHERDRIKKAFPQAVELGGDKTVRDWNAGKIELMLMHPASGGHGLNLQDGGHIAVWFGLTWSLELYQQFNARLDRQGQKHPVQIYRLIASGTVDEDCAEALAKKDAGQDALMRALKEKIKKF